MASRRGSLLGSEPAAAPPILDRARRRTHRCRMHGCVSRLASRGPCNVAGRHRPSCDRRSSRGRSESDAAAGARRRGDPASQPRVAPLGHEHDAEHAARFFVLLRRRRNAVHSHSQGTASLRSVVPSLSASTTARDRALIVRILRSRSGSGTKRRGRRQIVVQTTTDATPLVRGSLKNRRRRARRFISLPWFERDLLASLEGYSRGSASRYSRQPAPSLPQHSVYACW